MNKRRLLLASTLIGAMSLGSIAFADGHRGCGKHHKQGGKYSEQHMQKRMERLTDKLGLSKEQTEKMQAAMKSKRDTREDFRGQMKAVRENMRNLDPTADDYDVKLAELAKQKAELVRQMTVTKGKQRQTMAQILTPEQRAKMKQLRSERGEHRKRYKHHD